MDELSMLVVRSRLRDASRDDEFGPIRADLRRLGVDDATLVAWVAGVNNFPESQNPLLLLRGQILGSSDARPFLLERYALLLAAAQRVADLPALPLPDDVGELLLEELVRLTAPREPELGWFEAGRPTFAAMCKLVTLRRFPAGQFHWEVSGLPRSTFLRVKGLDRARLAGAALRLGGLAPLVVPHMPWRRPQLVLLERQQQLSYLRMAQAMQRQPQIRGLMAEAWFHAPDTYKVSPHLAWVNRVFTEWGGVVVSSGPAGPESGVFERGATRRRLAAEGKYAPTLGLVVWPRRAMLRWAAHCAGAGLQAAG